MGTTAIKMPTIADGEVLDAPMLDQIRRTAELRLQQIEPLIAEARQLREVLAVIEGRSARERSPAGDVLDAVPRAAKGANKRTILDLVAQRPGITAAEIAAATGMKRTVVASTVSRLKRQGELCEHERGGVRVAAGPTRGPSLVAVS